LCRKSTSIWRDAPERPLSTKSLDFHVAGLVTLCNKLFESFLYH